MRRKATRRAHRNDAGRVRNLIEETVVERIDRGGTVVSLAGRAEARRQNVIGVEPQPDLRQLGETPQQQAGADEQDHGESHLDRDERAP